MRLVEGVQTYSLGALGSPLQTRTSRWLAPYIIGIDVVALVVVLITLPGLPPQLWLNLAVLIAVTTLLDWWRVPMGRHGALSFSMMTTYATAILFGPCMGALTAAGGSLIADGLVRRKGIAKTAFSTGLFALCSGLSGLTFDAFRFDSSLHLTANALAYVMAAVVFILANTILASGAIALQGQPFARVWLLTIREGGIFFLAEAPLGALMVCAYSQSPWTLLYFPLVIWVFVKGFSLAAKLRTETDNALVVLANTIDKRDRYTYEHSVRVARYATEIAAELKLPGEDADLIFSAAQVHDLGKISIDNRILLKDGPLTDEERQQINSHSAAGAELAGQFSMYRAGAAIIRHHHERWDGTGYPDGLAGEAIPLGARIIAVADVYDAMTSDRPYRNALSHEVAVAELIRGRDSQFDARAVDAFLAPAEGRLSVAAPSAEALRALS
jgi:putative nucleotidyltransferase with HDIG domain